MEAEHTLYTTHCQKCRILEKKLADKGVKFRICDDVAALSAEKIVSVPVLELPDGKRLEYFEAVKYVNAL